MTPAVSQNPYDQMAQVIHELVFLAAETKQHPEWISSGKIPPNIERINQLTDRWGPAEQLARSTSGQHSIPFAAFDPVISKARAIRDELVQIAAGDENHPFSFLDLRYTTIERRLKELGYTYEGNGVEWNDPTLFPLIQVASDVPDLGKSPNTLSEFWDWCNRNQDCLRQFRISLGEPEPARVATDEFRGIPERVWQCRKYLLGFGAEEKDIPERFAFSNLPREQTSGDCISSPMARFLSWANGYRYPGHGIMGEIGKVEDFLTWAMNWCKKQIALSSIGTGADAVALSYALKRVIDNLTDNPKYLLEKDPDYSGGLNAAEINRLAGREIIKQEPKSKKGVETERWLIVQSPDDTPAERWLFWSGTTGREDLGESKQQRTLDLLERWLQWAEDITRVSQKTKTAEPGAATSTPLAAGDLASDQGRSGQGEGAATGQEQVAAVVSATVGDIGTLGKPRKASFGWLHLTDLHFGMDRQKLLWPNIEEEFFLDLKRLHSKAGPWDLVLFTGDFVQQGKTDEFKKLTDLLAILWEHLRGLGSTPILLGVPGNHDLVRPRVGDPEVAALREGWDDPHVQAEFWNPKSRYRKVLQKAFKNYIAWWQAHSFPRLENQSNGTLPGDFSTTLGKNGCKLGIVGLNTTFLQLGGGDYLGRLAVSPQQFHEACGGDGAAWTRGHDVCLLLTHQPPDWLRSELRQGFNAEIARPGRFAAHLFGHMHKPASRSLAEGGAEARREWQGCSLFGLEEWGEEGGKKQRLHGYSAGRIELEGDRGVIRQWPRIAVKHQAGHLHVVPDHSFTLEEDEGMHREPIRVVGPDATSGKSAQ